MSPLLSKRTHFESLRFSGLRRPLIMGILNVTPDSFYSSSRLTSADAAVEAGLRMEEAGADLLDVGGESTRPGSEPVSEEDEAKRVLPVLERLASKVRIPISIDTHKVGVASSAFSAGATILNDIRALRGDPRMAECAARYKLVILMHMLGVSPRRMQEDPRYGDVVGDIIDFFRERLDAFKAAGGDLGRVWLDPGIGFGKTVEQNLEILSRLEEYKTLGRPILVGASRKSFIGKALGSEEAPLSVEQRLEGSLAVACRAAEAGAVAVRVHDVAETRRALELWARVRPSDQAASRRAA